MRELIALLKRTGLNDYESRTYSSLLKLREAGASETSKTAGIPRARVYDVLMGLEKKGFVVVAPGRPVQFKALVPEIALSNFEKTKRSEFEEQVSELKAIKDRISSNFSDIKAEQSSSESVWLFKGRQAIYSAIDERLSKARERVVISTTEANALQKMNAFRQKITSLNKKGVKFTIKPSSSSSSSSGKALESFSELIEIKPSSLDSRFMVFDKSSVLLFLNKGEKEMEEKAVLIESPFVASYFSML